MNFVHDIEGVAAVEAAILFPILIALGFGAIDSSMMLLQNHKLEQGLVAGANYLSRAQNPDAVKSNARNFAVTGTIDGSGQPRVNGWAPNDVSLNIRNVANNGQYRGSDTIKIAELSTQQTYVGLGFIRLASGGRVTVGASHQERLVRAR